MEFFNRNVPTKPYKRALSLFFVSKQPSTTKAQWAANKGFMYSILEIKSLTLPVCLGQSLKERESPQEVVFHITIGWPSPLKEEQTDHLKDSVCYFTICERVRKLIAQQSFSLIERLAGAVWEDLKKILPQEASLKVCVHKVRPPVPFLKGGVSYTKGNLSLP